MRVPGLVVDHLGFLFWVFLVAGRGGFFLCFFLYRLLMVGRGNSGEKSTRHDKDLVSSLTILHTGMEISACRLAITFADECQRMDGCLGATVSTYIYPIAF